MINLQQNKNILGDIEILNNIAGYIIRSVGSQDYADHVSNISGYIAAGIHWAEKEVEGYLLERIKSVRGQ
jgi:hypothetical protein